ncbi:hypothetical protein CkaCkLH20_11346 [Colletotrichum karsti]|uniref:TRAF-type zinc finger n=1 Tax=Colletotrichum karsti TaxID=1095194 RepID=A0A9P6HWA4_9PEZI|nr:uncharacterized protein CkaCkLH20_11346 [Colletotrichum karsti]KAF9871177.1 hypothetical protein CkaCkLH20_11346 [Colletotrichum karsti]
MDVSANSEASAMRRTVPWDRNTFQNLSLQELGDQHRHLRRNTYFSENHCKILHISAAEVWSEYAAVAGRRHDMAAIQGHAAFLRLREWRSSKGLEGWVAMGYSEQFQIRYLAHHQLKEIAISQATSKHDGGVDNTRDLARLFASLKDGMGTTVTAFGNRVLRKHKKMARQMANKYCPDRPDEDVVWDPIAGKWQGDHLAEIAFMYPWRQRSSMNKLFGLDLASITEEYAPCNGIFLRAPIRRGLENGVFAIVPDVDFGLDSTNQHDEGGRQIDHVQEWWHRDVKEYKLVVLDPHHPMATGESFEAQEPLVDLDDRKLTFRTTFRPRVRYVWWSFLSAITVATWRLKDKSCDGASIQDRIQKAVRCWGYTTLTESKVTASFVRVIGKAAEPLLGVGSGETDADDQGIAVVAFERAYAIREEKDDRFAYYSDEDDDMFKHPSTTYDDNDTYNHYATMSQSGFAAPEDDAPTFFMHDLVEEAVRSVEEVPIPLAPRAPTQWPVEELATREARRYSLTPDVVKELIDFPCLNYVDEPDENLVCPICRLPIVTPVITPCDHTFCLECLKRFFSTSDTCPIDRTRFRAKDCKTSRLLTNMLGSLVVNCPNTERGCDETMKREEAVKHAIDCRYTLHDCPEKTCDKRVEQWRAVSGKCLHFEQKCEYCEEKMEALSMEDHITRNCSKNITTCTDCGETIKASESKQHSSERCPESSAPCKYGDYGCSHRGLRKTLDAHEDGCMYRVVAVVGEKVKLQEKHIEKLQKEKQEQEKQILELKDERRDCISWDDVFNLNNVQGGPKFKPTEAVMTIYEDMERRMEELKKEFTELEGRQTVMVLNQVIPIKDQITEIRSNLGILKMHMAWLMNKSREEVERTRLANRTVSGTSRTRGSSDSDGEASSSSRRLSDGSNGIPRL